MKTVPLYGAKAAGRVAFVDDEDYDLVMQYRWNVHDPEPKRPGRLRTAYAIANTVIDGRRTTVKMHILIMDRPYIDHMNHNGLDNRRENLRPATWVQNSRNMAPTSRGASRYKGVGFHSLNGRWRARIKTDAGSISLGVYATEEEAARAYDAAARKYYGEFAFLNFPDEGEVA
jgi:AP2 domain